MTLDQLRDFVAVAEDLNFSRAAERLNMARPVLSKSVQRLEKSLGVTLLTRTSRQVALTRAGEVLLREARDLLAHVERSAQLTKRVASEGGAPLHIGFSVVAQHRTLPDLLQTFRERYPAAEIVLKDHPTEVQITRLREGQIDIGFLSWRPEFGTEFRHRVLERTYWVLVVPSAWPLARRSSIRLTELRDIPIVIFSPELGPTSYATIMRACKEAGVTLNIAQLVDSHYTLLSQVASGVGVGFTKQANRTIPLPGVTFVPIEDPPEMLQVELAAAWVPRNRSTLLKRFLDCMDERLAQPVI